MKEVPLLALGSAVFPALLAGAAVLLSRERPQWLLVAFWFGGFLTSVTCGVVILLAFGPHSESLSTTDSGLSPLHSILFGVLALAIAVLLGTKRGDALIAGWRRRRAERKALKGGDEEREPWAERVLGNGSVTVAAIAGAILNLPGPFYLIALSDIAKAQLGFPAEFGLIIVFNLVMLTLIEVPIVGYLFAPERTDRMVGALSTWLNRHGMRIIALIALIGSASLISSGVKGIS